MQQDLSLMLTVWYTLMKLQAIILVHALFMHTIKHYCQTDFYVYNAEYTCTQHKTYSKIYIQPYTKMCPHRRQVMAT